MFAWCVFSYALLVEAQESPRPADPADNSADLADLAGQADPAGPANPAGPADPDGPADLADPADPAEEPRSGGTADPPLAGRPLINPRLANDARARVWLTRIVIGAAVFIGFMLGLGWRYAAPATALYLLGDVLYRSRTKDVVPASVRVTAAQRSTQRRLRMLQPAGYYALNTCQIPGTRSIIDHLVVGPAGVFSIDSERLDERLKVQIRQRGQFYHGANNQVDRIMHARDEAAQAMTLIGAELGQPVQVQPVMIIYGPDVPWKIMQFEGVDILNGGDIGTYFRRQSKRTQGRHLTPERINQIFNAATAALPPLDVAT